MQTEPLDGRQDSDRSRLDESTPERQDMDELVADGLEDDSNVSPEPEPSAEEEAVHVTAEGAASDEAGRKHRPKRLRNATPESVTRLQFDPV